MFAALATTLFFAVTPVFAHRSAALLGGTKANFWRLAVAVVLLGAWAHAFGVGLGGHALAWFIFGGVIGFGVGGVAMFQSLPRLGSNLSTLIVQCVSAVVAAAVEWLWLGRGLSAPQIAWVGLIIAGVAIGLLPRTLPNVSPTQRVTGVVWALVSALGQGAGAVISRKAFSVAAALHEKVDPGTAAYQRTIGGLLVALVVLVIVEVARNEPRKPGGFRYKMAQASPWVIANALTGPILGVTCYQWALRTTQAGIVQPIVAAAPLLTIPFAAKIEGGKPRGLYYVGALLASAGVAGLTLLR